ncbi:flagellar filament capping protein FliD [Petrotoga halophila]|jgi:flagellar hook-associated protein 2|uniref:flagellar filament capping protein FliD n=1 Tax=Petrotoga halophila TaxID=301141 RepID=UPI000CDEE5E9|nr:flagellar filament capping protein FliD [Petrotoga halophila]
MDSNPYVGAFQLTGAVSGMDTQAMVQKLMEVEQQPLNRAQEKFDTLTYKQKLWMEVDNKLEDFYDYLITFKLKSNLIPKSATSSDESVLTATAPADADNSTFYLKVNSLASPTVLLGQNIDSTITKSSTIGEVTGATGDSTFTITKGSDSDTITVSDSETIQNLIDKINASTLGVEAKFDDANGKFFIVNKENGDVDISASGVNPNGTELIKNLKLNGTPDSGDDNTVMISGSFGEVELSFDGNTTITTYDGLTENTLNVFGTTIDLKSTSSSYVKVSIEQDIDKSVENIKEFVDKYNETITYVYDLLHEDQVTDKPTEEMTEEDYMKGMLKGDNNLEKIFYNLRNMVYSPVDVEQSGSQYNTLFDIGITSGDLGAGYENTMKGLLSVDEDKLREALKTNSEDVWKLFATNDTTNKEYGYAQSVQNYLYEVTKFNGYIDQIAGTNGTIGNEMRRLADEMTNLLDRLQRKEAQYYAQFSAMEQAIQQLNAQGMYIQNAFSNK